jgi:hypothetical protein
MLAIVLFLRGHDAFAAVIAAAAVLTKEPMLLAFIGVALWRRDRRSLVLVVPPIVVAGVWFLYLHATVASGHAEVIEFGMPFTGMVSSVRLWLTGKETYAMASMVMALGLGAIALFKHRLRHVLAIALVLELAFLFVLKIDVIGVERNGTRMTLPAIVLAIVMIATPRPGRRRSPAREAIDHRSHGVEGVEAQADV